MSLEFMQENSNQLQHSRWEFFSFLSFAMVGTSAVTTDLVPKPFQRDPERFSHPPSFRDQQTQVSD